MTSFCRTPLLARLFFTTAALLLVLTHPATTCGQPTKSASPRIVNIVNFIRLLEPRSEAITEDVLYQTVVNQAELMKRHKLPGTFLLQYDALMDVRYQELLKGLPAEQFEIGAWWELPQPLVEKAGLRWRGRYPWDWHADVGFTSGYTPEEREKLADVYMADFKQAFGYYPKSVASWFIDAHTLSYLYEKYDIVASANCKDQVGTDGYTLWGGYWNQAYYPSKINAYMPAQTPAGQIPVPVFRMLGSDPLRQYDTGIGHQHQGVISLEPVYGNSGGNREWVEWFLKNLVEGECLAFNYTQAGQENSFTWRGMHVGLEHQFPLIARLRDEGQLRVETLGKSGEWFKRQYRTTPATAMTYLSPLKDDRRQTVWFNSRYYRASLIWEEGRLRIRDIHLFDESVESSILNHKTKRNAVEFFTLPVVDGFFWSTREQLAGLVFKATLDGKEVELKGGEPKVSSKASGQLHVVWPLSNVEAQLEITLDETTIQFSLNGPADAVWGLQLVVPPSSMLPFTDVSEGNLYARFRGHNYRVTAQQGQFQQGPNGLRIRPSKSKITLSFVKGGG